MRPDFLIWLVLFLPLLAAGIITLGRPRQRQVSATLSISAIVAGFILTIIYLAWAGWTPAESKLTWLAVGQLHVDFGLRLDTLSLLMLLIVTGVGSAIHIYSWGYLAEDPGFSRYFASLSLFTFSMLGIVLANNFLLLFVFWELVGVSSYLLIGFWFERAAAADAGKKAFLTNRLGDFGFLLGILLVWNALGTLHFGELQQALQNNPQALASLATLAGLLIFCGAIGKSAQFPLHVWLPDAMEGPTPVSALIHAATMVAAGVYMLCRVFFLLDLPGSHALDFIALIGAVTALLAALIAVQQNDIKRILAYSTLSQLGYMVMAVGLRGPTAAMFHLSTHAFFKALLFLGAGSVILALHHQQDIWKMGALRKKLPVTFWTFLVGTLALAGLPPFSGFYSKDSILAQALEHPNPWLKYPLFLLGVGVALLTAFYMFRLLFVTFYGPQKSAAAAQAHEPGPEILWPLRLLAVFSIIGGVLHIRTLLDGQFQPGEPPTNGSWWSQWVEPFAHSWVAALAGLLAAGGGIFAAYRLYYNVSYDPLPEKLVALSRAMRNRFYFDEFYEATVICLHEKLSRIAAAFDRLAIAGLLVRGTHGTTEFLGRALRLLQTGNLQTYAFLFALGVALVLFLALK